MKTLSLFKALERINGKTYFILTKNKKCKPYNNDLHFFKRETKILFILKKFHSF